MSVVGGGRHLSHQALVDFHVDILVVYPAELVAEGERRFAQRAHADGVEAYFVERGYLGSAQGVHAALVVHTVGEQDDDFALGFAVFDAVDGGGQAVAEGGAVAHHAAFEVAQLFEQHLVVHRQRHLGECLAGEHHQPHAVVLTAVDEFGGHFLGGLEAVGFEVLGQHTARDIHGQHDVDALHSHLLAAQLALRTCQRHHGGSHGHHTQRVGKPAQPHTKALLHAVEEGDV